MKRTENFGIGEILPASNKSVGDIVTFAINFSIEKTHDVSDFYDPSSHNDHNIVQRAPLRQ